MHVSVPNVRTYYLLSQRMYDPNRHHIQTYMICTHRHTQVPVFNGLMI